MAYVDTISPGAARGRLKALYDAAVARAGKVYQIVQVQSLNLETLQAGVKLYFATTTSPNNSLPRWIREAIAVAVSRVNDCHYWIEAHAADLRVELRKERLEAGIADALARGERPAVEPRWQALLAHAQKLTRTPAACTREDVAALRAHGFTDVQIVDAVQVAAYFNYINRVADALGVDPEQGHGTRTSN